MKKSKLLTLGMVLPTMTVAILPVTSCNHDPVDETQPTIVEQPNIKVTIEHFKLKEDLIISYTLTDGYLFDKANSTIKIQGTLVASEKVTYYSDTKKIIVDSSAITTGDIEIKLVAKADTATELVFNYDPELTWFTYLEDETLDLEGISITEKFESGRSKIVNLSDCTITPSIDTPLTLNDTQVTIEYDGLSCSYPIFVMDDSSSDVFIETYKENWNAQWGAARYEWEQLDVYGKYLGQEATGCAYDEGDPVEFDIKFGDKTLNMGGGSWYQPDNLKQYIESFGFWNVSFFVGKNFIAYKAKNDDDELLEEVIFKKDCHIEYYWTKDTSDAGIAVVYNE